MKRLQIMIMNKWHNVDYYATDEMRLFVTNIRWVDFIVGTHIDTVKMPTIPRNALKKAGYFTVEDVDKATDQSLLEVERIGERYLKHVREAIERHKQEADE
jgi:DNA-directed RNA polymerase alpha subunit